MEIRIDGSRSTSENWLFAHTVPSSKLPPITPEEQSVAEKLGISAEEYLRSRYAGDLTRDQLKKRAETVGGLVERWMSHRGVSGRVVAVWLKTFEGKFRIEIDGSEGSQLIFISEDLINDLLDAGSRGAQEDLDRLLAANFGLAEPAKAS